MSGRGLWGGPECQGWDYEEALSVRDVIMRRTLSVRDGIMKRP